jgi:hypothetical protein
MERERERELERDGSYKLLLLTGEIILCDTGRWWQFKNVNDGGYILHKVERIVNYCCFKSMVNFNNNLLIKQAVDCF